MPALHVFLGAGGVGKTTLSASYALALARSGKRVGLLGIDPARALHTALGLTLVDQPAEVPGAPTLSAAVFHPHQAVTRWAREVPADGSTPPTATQLDRLERNPFFIALSDRLATATDVLAAVRIAEWAERDPALTDMVVDTAPGVSAVGFLRAPQDVEALLEGSLISWLRGGGSGLLRFGSRRVLSVLGRLTGKGMIAELSDFFGLIGGPLERMIDRLRSGRRWLSSGSTELLVVTSPKDSAAAGAMQLVRSLRSERLLPRAVVLNRTWPSEVVHQLEALDGEPRATLEYARAYAAAQARALDVARSAGCPVVTVPAAASPQALARRDALLELGEALRAALTRAGRAPA